MGSMLAAGVVEQLFLTISPKLLGGGEGRPPLTGETDLVETALGGTLLGVRRARLPLPAVRARRGRLRGRSAPEPADPRGPRGVEIGAGREATVEPRIVMPCANAQAARSSVGIAARGDHDRLGLPTPLEPFGATGPSAARPR